MRPFRAWASPSSSWWRWAETGATLLGLLLGSAISAAVGLLLIQWIVARTRLTEDAAIGAVLGAVLRLRHRAADGDPVDVIGAAGGARGLPPGIDGRDAAAGRDRHPCGRRAGACPDLGLRRPMTLVSFDADFATAAGYNVSRIDLMMMASVLVVTVIGLKVVGLVLIVALLIIPPVAARFWTDQVGPHDLDFGRHRRRFGLCRRGVSRPPLRTFRPDRSSSSSRRPSSLRRCSSRRCAGLRPRRCSSGTSRRGCTSGRACWRSPGRSRSARPTPCACCSAKTLSAPDGVPTDAGRAAAAKVSRDERRWEIARQIHQDAGLTGRYDGLTPIEDVFTADEIRRFRPADRPARAVGGA
jgi:manganese/zinc/iron transport system permease protein